MIVGISITSPTKGREAIDMVKEPMPDLVVMDINMSDVAWVKATQILTQRHPDVKVFALTMHDQEEYIEKMLMAGAKGYLLKDTKRDGFLHAITAINAGQSYFSGALL